MPTHPTGRTVTKRHGVTLDVGTLRLDRDHCLEPFFAYILSTL